MAIRVPRLAPSAAGHLGRRDPIDLKAAHHNPLPIQIVQQLVEEVHQQGFHVIARGGDGIRGAFLHRRHLHRDGLKRERCV